MSRKTGFFFFFFFFSVHLELFTNSKTALFSVETYSNTEVWESFFFLSFFFFFFFFSLSLSSRTWCSRDLNFVIFLWHKECFYSPWSTLRLKFFSPCGLQHIQNAVQLYFVCQMWSWVFLQMSYVPSETWICVCVTWTVSQFMLGLMSRCPPYPRSKRKQIPIPHQQPTKVMIVLNKITCLIFSFLF